MCFTMPHIYIQLSTANKLWGKTQYRAEPISYKCSYSDSMGSMGLLCTQHLHCRDSWKQRLSQNNVYRGKLQHIYMCEADFTHGPICEVAKFWYWTYLQNVQWQHILFVFLTISTLATQNPLVAAKAGLWLCLGTWRLMITVTVKYWKR